MLDLANTNWIGLALCKAVMYGLLIGQPVLLAWVFALGWPLDWMTCAAILVASAAAGLVAELWRAGNTHQPSAQIQK